MTRKVLSPPRRSRAELAAASLDDPAAFAELFEEFRDFLRAEARRHLPPGPRAPADESDLVQETYLIASRRSTSFRGRTDAELAAWLRTILVHEARRHARAAAGHDPDALESAARLDRPDPGQAPPDEALVRAERDAVVRATVRSLSSEHLAVLELRFRDRLSFGEIGRRLGRSAEAARKLSARALGAVRRRLGRPDGPGP